MFSWRNDRNIYLANPLSSISFYTTFLLTLLLLNTTCPVLANSVDPDQLASEEGN